MPPEPVPYDRKDFAFRGERKIQYKEHPDALDDTGGGASNTFSTSRWRDQYHSPSPHRPISGHYKHVLADDSGSNGFTPLRSEGVGFRSSIGRYVSGSNRNDSFKEDNGFLRRSSWNSGDRAKHPHDSVATSSVQRSVADLLPSASASPPSSCQSTYLKDHRNKNRGGVNDFTAGTADDRDRDHLLGSISWKKWSRSGSFSSSTMPINRSHLDGLESEISGIPGRETPTHVAMMSPSFPDEGLPMKKQRLGWGQGLAKYEKQKVEAPEDCSGKDGVAHGGSRFTSTLSDSSSKMGAVSCVSPATPTSITCNSSRGVFDTVNNDVTSLCESPFLEHQRSPEAFSLVLDNPNVDSLLGLNSFISELLQPEEFCSGDSNFTMQTALNKLLLLKADILKEVEKTEGEIDYTENELKAIIVDSKACPNKGYVNFPNSYIQEFTSGSSPVSNKCQMNCSSEVFESKSKDVQSMNGIVAMTKSVSYSLTKGRSTDSSALTLENPRVSHDVTGIEELGTPIVFPIECDVIGIRPFACLANGLEAMSCAKSVEKSLDDDAYCRTVAKIMASNRESAKKASKALGSWSLFTSPNFDEKYMNKSVTSKIKERLSARKCILKFQERALVLKFRAFFLLWKEDLRLLAWWKHRQRSHKRCNLNYRSLQSGSQKNRSSLHFSFPGHSSLVPTREIVDFTNKMILHNDIKIHRCHLKMPALILDERERKQSVFVSNNGLIFDPFMIEKEKTLINLWTADEKMVFLEMLESFGKNFKKVASFLEHKTTADCVEFYYKNHRSDSFSAVKKILKLRKQDQALSSNKYMVASGKKWKEESSVGPLDMLGEISSIIAYSNDNKNTRKSVLKCAQDSKIYRWADAKDSSADYHARVAARDLLAGIGNSISSEGMDSCITSSVNPGEKVDLLHNEHPIFPEVSLINDEEDICSDEGFIGPESVDWTDQEKTLFINALRLYGRNFSQISDVIRTRSKEQCKVYFSKARKCLSLDMVYRGTSNCEVMSSSDADDARCDTDDASIAKIDPSTCVSQFKLDDFMQSDLEKNSKEFRQLINSFHRTGSSEQSGEGVSKHEVFSETIKTAFLPNVSNAKMSIRSGAQQFEMDLEEKPFVSIRNNNSEKICNDVDCTIMESNKMSQIPSAVTSDSDLIRQSEMMEFADPLIKHNCSCKSSLNSISNNCTSSQLDLTSHAAGSTIQQDNASCHFSETICNTNEKGQMKCHLSWKQKDNYASPLGKPLSSEMPYQHLEGNTNVAQCSSLCIHNPNIQHLQYSHRIDDYQHIPANQLLPRANPSMHILKGTIDADKFDQKLVSLHNHLEKSGSLDVILPTAPSVHGEEYGNCKHEILDHCPLLVPKSNGSPDPQLKPFSQDNESETEEQSLRTGDFKLFGKILTHPPLTPKSWGTEDKSPAKPSTSSLKLDNLTSNKDFLPSGSKNISHTSIEDLPLRTYGFWDGKRIQTGLASLPESTIILSKYPGVNYRPTKERIGPNGFRPH